MGKAKKKSGKKPKQLRIKGTERKDIIQDIEDAAAAYIEVRDERMVLTEREVETQAALVAAMDASKLKTYRCDAIEYVVEIVDAHKAKARRVAPPKSDGGDGGGSDPAGDAPDGE